MAAPMVMCAKLNKELPGIDPDTSEGQQALKMSLLLGGPDLQRRVREQVSMEAWRMWPDYMLMVVNEYRLDPTSDESNAVLGKAMEAFFFGDAGHVPGYVPPER